MRVKEKALMVDSIEVVVRDKYGNIKSKHTGRQSIWRKLSRLFKPNCITKFGMAGMASRAYQNGTVDPFIYMAIGDNNTAETVNDSTLNNEVIRVSADCSRTDTDYTNDTTQYIHTFSKANDESLTGFDTDVCEVGIFNDDTAGIMLLRKTWTPSDHCDWDGGDTIQITVKVQQKQGT